MWETDWLPWELCFWEHFPYNKESCMGQSRGKLGRTRSAPDHLLCRWYKKAGLRKTMNMLKETMRKWDSREHQHVPCRNEETAHPLYFVVCLISALALEQNQGMLSRNYINSSTRVLRLCIECILHQRFQNHTDLLYQSQCSCLYSSQMRDHSLYQDKITI